MYFSIQAPLSFFRICPHNNVEIYGILYVILHIKYANTKIINERSIPIISGLDTFSTCIGNFKFSKTRL